MSHITKEELSARLTRFKSELDSSCPGWELCALVGNMNIYYLTGTICDGVYLINKNGWEVLWVKRSYERAVSESPIGDIRPLRSFRDVASFLEIQPKTLYLDMTFATMEWYSMFTKYVRFDEVKSCDKVIFSVRSIKSEFEIKTMRRAGTQIERLLIEKVPLMLRDGVSETDLCAEMYAEFVKNGHHGLSRFTMRNADTVLGHICFGESALYPSVFNGASGIAGLHPAAPVLGSRESRLKPRDLIYVDVGYGEEGYNVDKTLVFSYAEPQPDYITQAHRHCLELERLAASMLVPGAKPSDIYNAVMAAVKPEYRSVFMGTEGRTVKFIGHSVGLYIDETPVIAAGFDEPLRENMTIAIEPKMGIQGAGMVGSENTYLIGKNSAYGITGEPREIIVTGRRV